MLGPNLRPFLVYSYRCLTARLKKMHPEGSCIMWLFEISVKPFPRYPLIVPILFII